MAAAGYLSRIQKGLTAALHAHHTHGHHGDVHPTEQHDHRHSIGSVATVYDADCDISSQMVLEKLKLSDVNGLVGKCQRNPFTSTCYLKEVESWRDFNLVDLFGRIKIAALPSDHANDPYLFIPKPLNMRTWVYHDKVRHAQQQNQLGADTEVFIHEALAERCIDVPIGAGLWSPVVVYIPLLPFTLLTDDTNVFWFAAFVFFASLITAQFMNSSTYYFWTRPATLPARLAFLAYTVARIKGGSFQIFGYLVTILATLADLLRGDFLFLINQRYFRCFEILRHLPHQVYICSRGGDSDSMLQISKRRVKHIPQGITGQQDPGDGSLCIIANVAGVLLELEPLDKLDGLRFVEDHAYRISDMSQGRVKFFSLELFSSEMRSVQDHEASQATLGTARRVTLLKDPRLQQEMKVEDVA